ncbi:MAG: sodium:solute symporter [Bacteroidota bacterium]|nr:sodium:solute symporter [Bacteroidota bacterium]
MHYIDWLILISVLLFIVLYGSIKAKGSNSVKEYILGNNQTPWYIIGISVMATQASAITFLSTPGQAYHDGMEFIQFYFGQPLAMLVVCMIFIPIYHRLKVYTAYQYLEERFDSKSRFFTASLFLISRGLSTGFTIYTPSIVLSTILGWDLILLNIAIGTLVILYTVIGGTNGVNLTQKYQMYIITIGMIFIFGYLLYQLPSEVTLTNAFQIAGINNKMQVIDFSVDFENPYTFWSGITGGFFLALSYFGTDQSQVGRYLSGKSVRDSRLGLLFNAVIKLPFQFFILSIGILIFVFFQFHHSPLHFNPVATDAVMKSQYADQYQSLERKLENILEQKIEYTLKYANQLENNYDNSTLQQKITSLGLQEKELREQAKELIVKSEQKSQSNDKDYVLVYFILHFLPKGIVGLLLAVIISAAMSSTAASLNALAATTTMDLYKKTNKDNNSAHLVKVTKIFTIIWGVLAITFACYATLFENLIQLVNILGSIFYGVILGVFLVGFFLKKVNGTALFYGAILSQIIVIVVFALKIIGYLWLNVIGAIAVILLSFILELIINSRKKLSK